LCILLALREEFSVFVISVSDKRLSGPVINVTKHLSFPVSGSTTILEFSMMLERERERAQLFFVEGFCGKINRCAIPQESNSYSCRINIPKNKKQTKLRNSYSISGVYSAYQTYP
jgi:hypothetical protein